MESVEYMLLKENTPAPLEKQINKRSKQISLLQKDYDQITWIMFAFGELLLVHLIQILESRWK